MTITKNSTYYVISGEVNNTEIGGNISIFENGEISIDVNLANNINANFTKSADGRKNLSVSYFSTNEDVDNIQQIIDNILVELGVTLAQTQD